MGKIALRLGGEQLGMMAHVMKNSLLFVKWFKKIFEQGKKNQFEGGGMSIFILHGLRDHI